MKAFKRQEHSVPSYYPWFDWLRGVLAVTVMLAHEGVLQWSKAGPFAVEVFFALSGWLIGGVLLGTSRENLPRFFFNRSVRIWVPYYIALALLLAVSLLRDPFTLKWAEFALYKLTFVYNLFGTQQLATFGHQMPLGGTGNHFWSVNAEEQFYLVAPLALVLLARRFGRSTLLWTLCAAVAWTVGGYASIVFGVCAAVIASNHPGVLSDGRTRAALGLAGLIGVAGLAAGLPYERLAPVVAICIVLVLAVKGAQKRLGVLVGGMSYPLYLNHWIGVFVAHAAMRPFGLRESPLSHLLSFVFNIALAVGLYVYIERPLLQRRSAWYTPQLGRCAAVAAYAMLSCGLLLGIGFLVAGTGRV